MTRERHMILDISSSKEEAPQDEFIDHSLKIKKYLEAKAEEAGGISSEKLIEVFKEAAKEEAEMVFCLAKINNFLELFLGNQSFKTAVANEFFPEKQCFIKAKEEVKEFGLEEIVFEDASQFYLETEMMNLEIL